MVQLVLWADQDPTCWHNQTSGKVQCNVKRSQVIFFSSKKGNGKQHAFTLQVLDKTGLVKNKMDSLLNSEDDVVDPQDFGESQNRVR